jgi:hypothetical protein
MSVTTTSLAAARGASRFVDRLLEVPRAVLATLAAAQIALTLVLAFRVQHNGWVYYQGGDQIWFTTSGWLLGRLELAPTEASYLWPLVQAPITLVTGPTYVQALPPLVLGNVLVLGPLALLCVYGIAARIGGRLLGYWAGLLWVLAPYAAIPLFVDRYHEKWNEQFLPQATGLTAMADFPSMVALLAAAFFVTRSLSPGRVADAALAGLLLGSPIRSLGAGAREPRSRCPSPPPCSCSRSGSSAHSGSCPSSPSSRLASRRAWLRSRSSSTSTATSTSTSTTGAPRWMRCGSSSGVHA